MAGALLASGCATGHRVMTLPIPDTGAMAAPKGQVYLAEITDARKFEDPIDISGMRAHPVDDLIKPSVPKGEAASSLTAQDKAVTIGLQRRTTGGAVAPAILSEGENVTERTRELITRGFRKMGYAVVDDPKAATTVTATVDEFWGWEWAYMSAQFGANVAVTLTLKHGGKTYEAHVRGSGINVGSDMKSSNWQKAFAIAFKDFVDRLGIEVEKAERAGSLAAGAATAPAAPGAKGAQDARARLAELKKMLDDGLITQEQYDQKRQEILDQM